jgi:transposase-like protein
MNHFVVKDQTSSGHERYTCLVCNEQVVKQYFMTEEDWNIIVTLFLMDHEQDEPEEGEDQ